MQLAMPTTLEVILHGSATWLSESVAKPHKPKQRNKHTIFKRSLSNPYHLLISWLLEPIVHWHLEPLLREQQTLLIEHTHTHINIK